MSSNAGVSHVPSGSARSAGLVGRIRVLALAAYPVEAAATRYRLSQYVGPLAARGVDVDIRPFVDSRLFKILYQPGRAPRVALGLLLAALRRVGDAVSARRADVILVQREAMMFGPPVVEWLAMHVGRCPLLLDLDDAVHIRYVSPTHGRLASALKCFGKTDDLIRWSRLVICGNRFIAEYVESKGGRSCVIPSAVDTDTLKPPRERQATCPVVGWIGTHSTYPFLRAIIPAIERAAQQFEFRVRIIGSGGDTVRIRGVEVESVPWVLEHEVPDFQSLDIGLYPIDPHVYGSAWVSGKSGLKAVQYMAVGIPFVVTPVGVCAEMGMEGVTHLCASTPDDWTAGLTRLLGDRDLRRRMGAAGRDWAVRHYAVREHVDTLARVFVDVSSA